MWYKGIIKWDFMHIPVWTQTADIPESELSHQCANPSPCQSLTEIYTQDYMLHIRKEEKALLKKAFVFPTNEQIQDRCCILSPTMGPPWLRSCNSPDEIFSKEQLRHLADTFGVGGGGSVAAKSFGKRPKLQRLCHRVLAVYNNTPTHTCTQTHKRGHLFLMRYIN